VATEKTRRLIGTLFGAVEGDDATAAIDYLRTLKTPAGKQQIGLVGIYGVEMGAYAGPRCSQALSGSARAGFGFSAVIA
jgi:hypothetical protein